MTSRKRKLEELAGLCGEFSEEDGVPPKWWNREKRTRDRRKDLQLCRQVARTLSVSLAAHSDERLRALWVVSVDPAPDSSHLLVLVASGADGPEFDESTISTLLIGVSGVFRTEVANEIHRKRAPELTFRYLGRELSDG